jgi:hypothetical protein
MSSPGPGCDSTQILPPCISMMRFDIASPKPVPLWSEVSQTGNMRQDCCR